MYWLFSKRERFTRVYDLEIANAEITRRDLWHDLIKVLLGVTILAISAQGIVYGASLLATGIGMPLLLVGILVIGFGGALPEVYFTIITARRGETSMIVGNLMGAVIIPATLVLGIVAVIHPISNSALEFPLIGRVFLVLIALFFLYVSQTRNVITRREGYILLTLYVLFLLSFFIML
jgi:cation:H+ antiporter